MNSQSHRTMFICVHAKLLQSCLILCDPMDCSPPVSSSMGFSWQKYWSGLPFPSPGDLPNPGIKPMSLMSSALIGMFFTSSTTNLYCCIIYISHKCHRDRLGPEAWGPLLQCLYLDKHLLKQRNCNQLKTIACMCSWGKLWTKDAKKPETQLSILKSLEQKLGVGSKSRVLSLPPELNTT